jgi:protein arginine N-methyltransferase 2
VGHSADCGVVDASFYDVYTQLAGFHLGGVGIDVEWEDIDVAMREAIRWGDTRGYFCMRLYRLAVGRMRNKNKYR